MPLPLSTSANPRSIFARNTRRSIASSKVASAGSFSTAARTLCLAVLTDFAARLDSLLPMARPYASRFIRVKRVCVDTVAPAARGDLALASSNSQAMNLPPRDNPHLPGPMRAYRRHSAGDETGTPLDRRHARGGRGPFPRRPAGTLPPATRLGKAFSLDVDEDVAAAVAAFELGTMPLVDFAADPGNFLR